eukprot:Tbor_TRINITY_DN5839_c0_g3::TRINITY_DN5839_c0_g3_i1::g.6255::m.6255
MYNSLQVIAKITASYFDNIKSKGLLLNAGSRLSGASGTRASFTDSLLPLPHSISDMGSIGNNSITVMNVKKISDGEVADSAGSLYIKSPTISEGTSGSYQDCILPFVNGHDVEVISDKNNTVISLVHPPECVYSHDGI